MKYFIYALVIIACGLFYSVNVNAQVPAISQQKADRYVPRAAEAYRAYLIRESRFHFGLEAPVSLFASQIHQESRWNPRAQSPYAMGLTQFTPDTEKWIISLFPSLGKEGVWDPHWAIRAMLVYNKRLKGQIVAETECDDWAFVLSAYNGGLGWVLRDKTQAQQAGKNRNLWWGNVELYSRRAPQFIHENRDYPVKIIMRHQPHYLATGKWGPTVVCEERVYGVK